MAAASVFLHLRVRSTLVLLGYCNIAAQYYWPLILLRNISLALDIGAQPQYLRGTRKFNPSHNIRALP